MKILLKLWPWKRIHALEVSLAKAKRDLESEIDRHESTTRDRDALLQKAEATQKHVRKMANIIAIKGGIIGLFLMCMSVSAQPLLRQLFTTNPPPGLSSITGPFLTTNGVGLPVWTYNGGAFTNISGIGPGGGKEVAQGTNVITATNGSVVTVNGTTDTNMINTFLINATNFTLLVGANDTNHDWVIGQNATNFGLLIGLNATNNDANSTNFGLLIGLNATNNDNLHAANNTNFSLLIGLNATNNDANSTNFALLIGANDTNNDWVIGANSTNQSWLIGLNATNNDANSTNFGLLIGANATNHDWVIGQNDTNQSWLIGQNSTNNDTVVSNGITGRIIKSLGITVDGGGSVLTSGVKGYLEVPVACTIISATILADQSGSIAIETWRTNSASMPPTRAGVLFTNYLTSAQSSIDSTLTGATSTTLSTQDRLGFNIITNAASVTRVTLQLRVQP